LEKEKEENNILWEPYNITYAVIYVKTQLNWFSSCTLKW